MMMIIYAVIIILIITPQREHILPSSPRNAAPLSCKGTD